MVITTKFDIGEEVFFVDGEKGIITKGSIQSIIIKPDVILYDYCWTTYRAQNVFKTKEQAEKRSKEIYHGNDKAES